MEPQEEAPTLGESVPRPPGASGSPTPDEEEEPPEGSAPLAAAPAGADGLWGLPVEHAERRPECSRCSRPQKVCLCPYLPVYPLQISTHLYIIQHPAEVQLKTSICSQYVIRMQPTSRCLSTLECAAAALSILEKNNYIQETLLRPLQALCSFQLQHGAQIRLSKEYLLKNGLYPKPMPKNKRKLRKMELLMNSVKI
ncbi:tRNA-uridine aminocarboxypropyltransferase 2 isoform X2 [Peromyscus californicus insignis]|uniref:tRNA-uridine aminocarboxypropyltransferase 2 isoform X2 n=1 Tax=Peromyscus californicus insignis TaxID=564181 RepID=UPI0022A7D3FC|nr:tRNA-uridine aminocarboxypropyltransferase 2 isoform X2 [Peromyscus californicus insignis]